MTEPTARQTEIHAAYQKHGSYAAAGRALGITRQAVTDGLRVFHEKTGVSIVLPDGVPSKVSTLYNSDGEVSAQWVQEKPADKEKLTAWKTIISDLTEGIPPAPTIPAPKRTAMGSDLLVGYPIGDHHLGMLAWGKETGGDSWDIKIAEKALQQSTDYLVDRAPVSDHALVAFLGDFMHYDSFEPKTPTAGNILDADGRFPKMVSAALRSMRRTIEGAASKHKSVRVIIEIGNHDLSSSIFLQQALRMFYEDNPRITIDASPAHYHYFEFGQNLIGTHHGHGPKMPALPGIMATDQPTAWGRTKYRVWWTGHIHHTQIHEFPGATVESFRVLAPKDAWHHQRGYRSAREMKAIVFAREHGEVSRLTVNPEVFS